MQKRISALKSALAGVAAIAALAVAPVLAAPPSLLVDAGSDYYTARVAGSGFSYQGMFRSPSQAAAVVYIMIANTFDGSRIYGSTITTTGRCYEDPSVRLLPYPPFITRMDVWYYCDGSGTFYFSQDMSGHPCSDAPLASPLNRWAYIDAGPGAGTDIVLACPNPIVLLP